MASCTGYAKIGDTHRHGSVPKVNPVKEDQVVVEKDSSYAFLLIYTPILLGVVYMTWKTFKPTPKTN